MEVSVPDLGEGIEEATVVGVLVNPGDTVTDDQGVVEVETDKASMPIPAGQSGTVEEVLVSVGDKVTIGTVLLKLKAGEKSSSDDQPKKEPEPESDAKQEPESEEETEEKEESKKEKRSEKPEKPKQETKTKQKEKTSARSTSGGNGLPVPASPSTRRFARELGVDVGQVSGSAEGGRVVVEDIKEFVRDRVNGGGGGFAPAPLPDFSKYGEIERKSVSRLRETIARNMTSTWHTCPMVTQHDVADVTDLEAGRRRVADSLPKGSPKITMTVLAVKAVVAALKSFPNFNASFDMAAGEVILKKYIHIGIAVDTERGLVVPVIRDADKKSLTDIAREVTELAGQARDNKLSIEQMRGGTFTITNLGGIGGTAFTPIVNHPEVAILGIARSRQEPVYLDGEFVPRLMMPLCLTYDHRIIDGADGARFTSRLREILSDPIRLLMEG